MERVLALQAKVAADPYDAASWEQLVAERKEAKRRNSDHVAELRATYDELLKVFPTAVSAGTTVQPGCKAKIRRT